MNKNTKYKINLILILIIFIFSSLFIVEYKKPNTETINNKNKNSTINLEKIESSDSVALSHSEYLEGVSYYSKVFTEILNKYGLNTIMTTKDSDSFRIYETSILLEALDIPNGYKTTYINIENNEVMKTYISLVDTLKDMSWNRILNINISSNSSILEFNESNYPEVYELLNNFIKDIDIQTLEFNVNNLINDGSSDILNEYYSISKSNENNSTFLQISIYLDNGTISDN